MGSPKKNRKKYTTPLHPWRVVRIEKEKALDKVYGFKNRKEIWKMDSLLKEMKSQAKKLIAREGAQSVKEEKLLKERAFNLGLIDKEAKLEDILGLNIEKVLERRLQTQVFKLGLARSVRQARQFIVHGHILVDGSKVNVPSYLLKRGEETKIKFDHTSTLNSTEHPERKVIQTLELKGKLELEEKKVLKALPLKEAPAQLVKVESK